jgi:hypothetical protein
LQGQIAEVKGQVAEAENNLKEAVVTSLLISILLSAPKLLEIIGGMVNKIAAKYAKNTVFIKALRESQSLWIKFRSAEINMMFPGANGPKFYGSAYPMCANLVAEGITKKRIAQLNKWLKPASDEDICTVSIGDTAAD